MASASDALAAIMLAGTMGLVGQGARAAVGFKKLNDSAQSSDLDWQDLFVASRLIVSLIIGFIAGVAAALALDLNTLIDMKAQDSKLLLGLAAAGYAGTDIIEAFVARLNPIPKTEASVPGTRPDVLSKNLEDLNRNITVLTTTMAAQEAPPALVALSPQTTGTSDLRRDLAEANKYLTEILDAAQSLNVEPELICAIGSRESNWGQGSDMRPKGPQGTGDWAPRNPDRWGYAMPPDGLGWGRGLMQIDYAQSDFGKTGNWKDPAANIRFGTEELASNISHFKAAPRAGVDPLAAAVAAYNCGRGNVERAIARGINVDSYTTGHDYSKDVLSRAAWFKASGFGTQTHTSEMA